MESHSIGGWIFPRLEEDNLEEITVTREVSGRGAKNFFEESEKQKISKTLLQDKRYQMKAETFYKIKSTAHEFFKSNVQDL